MNEDDLLQKLDDYGADTDGAMERFLDDAELYEQCLQLFVDDKNFAQLASALADAEYGKAFDAVHALKGVSANLGLTPAYQAVCELVEALRANRYERLEELHAAIEAQRKKIQTLL